MQTLCQITLSMLTAQDRKLRMNRWNIDSPSPPHHLGIQSSWSCKMQSPSQITLSAQGA